MPFPRKHGAWSSSVTIVVIGVSACGGGDVESDQSALATGWDSAGVRIVESASPRWVEGGEWWVDSVPEVTIGSAPAIVDSPEGAGVREEVPFAAVGDVDVLSDGRIVVADPVGHEVVVFDSAGEVRHRFGGRGEGPGEFRRISAIHTCAGDSIVVLNGNVMEIFDDVGQHARRVRGVLHGNQVIEAVSSTCDRSLVWERASSPPPEEIGPVDLAVAWVSPELDNSDTVVVATMADGWTRTLYGETRPWAIPWGTGLYDPVLANDGADVVAGNGRVPELRRFDAMGRLKSIVRWRADPEAVDIEDRRRYSNLRVDWLESMPDHEEIRFHYPALDEYPMLPAHKPLFQKVMLDEEGSLWVLEFPSKSFGDFENGKDLNWEQSEQVWRIFSPEGVWLGRLKLPQGFELRAVVRDRLYGVATGAFDVETVDVYRLHRPTTG